MKTSYEWSHEVTDEHGDIIEVDFADLLSELGDAPTCLVKRQGDSVNLEDNRTYAYITDGVLPEFFEDGTKVPVRFHTELKNNK